MEPPLVNPPELHVLHSKILNISLLTELESAGLKISIFKRVSRFMWSKNWIFQTIVFSNLCPMLTITGRHPSSQCCCNLSMSFFLPNYTPKYLSHTSQPTATKYNIKYQSPAVVTQALWYFMLQWKSQGASCVFCTSFWILIGWFYRLPQCRMSCQQYHAPHVSA